LFKGEGLFWVSSLKNAAKSPFNPRSYTVLKTRSPSAGTPLTIFPPSLYKSSELAQMVRALPGRDWEASR